MINVVAEALGELLSDVVFVGGATTSLYINDTAVTDMRPTTDVDCIVEVANRFSYNELEKKLMAKRFSQSHNKKNDPICR